MSELQDIGNDILSADDAHKPALIQDRYSSKLVVDETLDDVEKTVFLVKTDDFSCHETLNRGNAPDYVRRLLAAFSVDKPAQAETITSQSDQSELQQQIA